MSVLSAIQSAAPYLGLEKPTAVFGSSDQTEVELAAIANEVLVHVRDAHDWQALNQLGTISGDGSTINHTLPSNFDKFRRDTQLWSTKLDLPLQQTTDPDYLLRIIVKDYQLVRPVWMLLGDAIVIRPALESGHTVRYYYQTDLAVQGSSTKNEFTADDDVMRIGGRNPDELLRLGIIARWRLAKAQASEAEEQRFQYKLSQEIMRDRGTKTLVTGKARGTRGISTAYPVAVT